MFGNLKGQLETAQKEMKEKLAETRVKGEAEDGKVEVVVNGNRKMISLNIASELYETKKQKEIQDLIIEASNQALDQAEKIAEDEMMDSAKNMLPGII